MPVTLDETLAAIELAEHHLEEIDASENGTTDPERLRGIAGARSAWSQKLDELLYWEERLRAGELPSTLELERANETIAARNATIVQLESCVRAADDRAREADEAFFNVKAIEDLQAAVEARDKKIQSLHDTIAVRVRDGVSWRLRQEAASAVEAGPDTKAKMKRGQHEITAIAIVALREVAESHGSLPSLAEWALRHCEEKLPVGFLDAWRAEQLPRILAAITRKAQP